MKLKKLKLDNFAKFTDFEVEFDGNLTHLVGVNGAGKTTVGITAVWAGLKGISEKSNNGQLIGERFRFIGPKKASANIEITLVDEKTGATVTIKNHISKTTNKITFTADDGHALDDNWLHNLLSVAFLSAKNFSSRNTQEQALLLGIDTSQYDEDLKDLKADYTLVNRDYRAYGELIEVAEVKPVSVSDLMAQYEAIKTFNEEQQKAERVIEKASGVLSGLEVDLEEVKAEQEVLATKREAIEARIAKGKDHIKGLPEALPVKDDSNISDQIKDAEETNRQAAEHQAYLVQKKGKDEIKVILDQNKADQEKVTEDRLNYIKSFNFGFEGLEVDESGGLLLNERPIASPYYSKGELEIIVAKLYASLNPELKVRFIDDFELLDEDNQKAIIDTLIEEDFQIITAEIGKVAKENNTILLRECRQVGADSAEEKKVLVGA